MQLSTSRTKPRPKQKKMSAAGADANQRARANPNECAGLDSISRASKRGLSTLRLRCGLRRKNRPSGLGNDRRRDGPCTAAGIFTLRT